MIEGAIAGLAGWLAFITGIVWRHELREARRAARGSLTYFREGEKVRVYSLQSFSGPGFIDGKVGTVLQDQIGGSVLVILPGRENAYEVFPEQLRRV